MPRLSLNRQILTWLGSAVAATAFFGLILLLWINWRYGSVTAAQAHVLDGYVLFAEEPLKSLGPLHAGHEVSASFALRNVESVPVTIHGAEKSCACILTEQLPVTLEPGECRQFHLVAKTSAHDAGKTIEECAALYTSPPGRQLILRLRVQVLDEIDQ